MLSADRSAGERFLRALGRVQFPPEARGKSFGAAALGASLPHIHAEHVALGEPAELSDERKSELQDCDAFIVLCTPAAARSERINEEIRVLRRMGREEVVHAVVLDGEFKRYDAANSPHGAFPPALYERYDAAGVLITYLATNPDAPVVGRDEDALAAAAKELASSLTGVPVEMLVQHRRKLDRASRQGLQSILVAISAAAIVAFVGAGAATLAWRNATVRADNAAVSAADNILARAELALAGADAEQAGEILSQAEAELRANVVGAPKSDAARGEGLATLARLYQSVGDAEHALALAREADDVLANVETAPSFTSPTSFVAEHPSNRALARMRLDAIETLSEILNAQGAESADLVALLERGKQAAARAQEPMSEAHFSVLLGEQAAANADAEGAVIAFQSALTTLQDQPAAEPPPSPSIIAEVEAERLRAQIGLAEALFATGEAADAATTQAEIVAAYEDAYAAARDAEHAQPLYHALLKLSDMQFAATRGEGDDALASAERAIALANTYPIAEEDFALIATALEFAGTARFNARSYSRSVTHFEQAVALRRALAEQSPGDSAAERNLALALEHEGDAVMARRQARDALESYDEARRLLARANQEEQDSPDNVFAYGQLWFKTAQARAAIGDTENWSGAYAAALQRLQPVATADGAPIAWRRTLADVHYSYANRLARADRTPAAVRHWRSALEQVEFAIEQEQDDEGLQTLASRLRARLNAAGAG